MICPVCKILQYHIERYQLSILLRYIFTMIPNHVLVLGAPNTGKLKATQAISATDLEFESVDEKSHSGLIFKTDLSTKYYSLKLNLLVDEYPEQRDTLVGNQDDEEIKIQGLKQWYNDFVSEDFQELREAIDGLIVCFNIDKDLASYLETCVNIISDLRDNLNNETDKEMFIVIVGDSHKKQNSEDFEDLVTPFGFEYIYLFEKGEDEYRDKIGEDRLIEIMQTHDWSHMDVSKETNSDINRQRKINEMNMMTERLLNEHEGEKMEKPPKMDVSEILTKLQIAKQNVQELNDEEKEAYVHKVIKNVVDFI